MSEPPQYTIELSERAQKSLERLPKTATARVTQAINALAMNPRPRGVKKLKTKHNDYRIRVSNYRIIYRIVDQVLLVLVLDVDDRKDVYKRR
jgi:mRNA interferase RelE/StbE